MDKREYCKGCDKEEYVFDDGYCQTCRVIQQMNYRISSGLQRNARRDLESIDERRLGDEKKRFLVSD